MSREHHPGAAPVRPTIRRPRWVPPQIGERMVADFLHYLGALHQAPWMREAACGSSSDPDAWFPKQGRSSARTRRAIATCTGCPVARQCLDYALQWPSTATPLRGIWGGTTDNDRRTQLVRDRGATT